MKFKEGDKVKVKLNTSIYFSKTATIEKIHDDEWRGRYIYAIDIDNALLYRASDLELIAESKTLDNLEVGDKILFSNDVYEIIGESKTYLIKSPKGVEYTHSLTELKHFGCTPFTQPTTTIDGKTYILNDELKKAIELAEEI